MRIASIDVGLKRIGVALAIEGIVIPKDAILRKNRNQASRDVSELLREFKIDTLIVGIPMEGESQDEMTRRVKHFTSLLDFDGKIYFQDESFSSFEAKELVKGQFRQKRDGKIDSLSAKLILERWLKVI